MSSSRLFWTYCRTKLNSATNVCKKNTQNAVKKQSCGWFLSNPDCIFLPSIIVMHDVHYSHFYCFGFCLVFTTVSPLVYFPIISMCSMLSSLAPVYLYGWVRAGIFGWRCSLVLCCFFLMFLKFVLLYPHMSLSLWEVLSCMCYFKSKTCFHVSVFPVYKSHLLFGLCLWSCLLVICAVDYDSEYLISLNKESTRYMHLHPASKYHMSTFFFPKYLYYLEVLLLTFI